MRQQNPNVDVVIFTHNHEKYIRECLESIIMNAPDIHRVIIHDDASTDATRAIINEYKAKLPNPLFVFQDNSIFLSQNLFLQVVPHLESKYIAFCEGDDFWNNSKKIRIQRKLLERFKEVNLCFSAVNVACENPRNTYFKQVRLLLKKKYPKKLSGTRLGGGNFIATCSVMVRRSSINVSDLVSFGSTMPADWLFFCSIAGNNGMVFSKRRLSTYRVHDEGYWSSSTQFERDEKSNFAVIVAAGTLGGPIGRIFQERLDTLQSGRTEK